MFASGVDAIVEAQRLAACYYFEDGSVAGACPPLRALLHIMAYGQYEGKAVSDPEIRAMFTRESLLASDWYRERLRVNQERDIALWSRHVAALESFSNSPGANDVDVPGRLSAARAELARVKLPAYLTELVGTLGADPFTAQD